MTGDLMINLASKQTISPEMVSPFSQSNVLPNQQQQQPETRLPFRRKKTNQSSNLHSSSIQFGYECVPPYQSKSSIESSTSLPSSPEASTAGQLRNLNGQQQCQVEDSTPQEAVRLSRSESQLKPSNGVLINHPRKEENPIDDSPSQVVMDSVSESLPPSNDDNLAQEQSRTTTNSQGTSTTALQISNTLDARLSVSSATSSAEESRECSSPENGTQQEVSRNNIPLSITTMSGDEKQTSVISSDGNVREVGITRASTFNKKDIERLHALREMENESKSTSTDSVDVSDSLSNSTKDSLSTSQQLQPPQQTPTVTSNPHPSSSSGTPSQGAAHVSTVTTTTSIALTPQQDNSDVAKNPAKTINTTTTSAGMRYPSFLAGSDSDTSPDDSSEDLTSPHSFSVAPTTPSVDVASATRLAKRLFDLQGFKKSDVCRHLSKNNDFSQVVADEYAKLFDFTDERLDTSLRKFLSKFSLVGETSERERVLTHFSRRYFECNPGSFSSTDSIHTLTCALMLLNTDLHTDTVGRKMTCSEFMGNLTDLHDGKNFDGELLKTLYASIKNEPLQWAVDEEDSSTTGKGVNLISLLGVGSDRTDSARLTADSINPFLAVPSGSATEFKKGYLIRKTCFDPTGKKTPIGKRNWKTFYATLRDLVLYLHKDEHGFQKNQLYDSLKNCVRVHHALASKACDYSKKDFVFRLHTADQAEYLFKAR